MGRGRGRNQGCVGGGGVEAMVGEEGWVGIGVEVMVGEGVVGGGRERAGMGDVVGRVCGEVVGGVGGGGRGQGQGV